MQKNGWTDFFVKKSVSAWLKVSVWSWARTTVKKYVSAPGSRTATVLRSPCQRKTNSRETKLRDSSSLWSSRGQVVSLTESNGNIGISHKDMNIKLIKYKQRPSGEPQLKSWNKSTICFICCLTRRCHSHLWHLSSKWPDHLKTSCQHVRNVRKDKENIERRRLWNATWTWWRWRWIGNAVCRGSVDSISC